MPARWGSFAIGLGLVFAPLLLGYGSARAIVHDVAMGVLVCAATLAALEWPRVRFALVAPALWLLATGRGSPNRAAGVAELAAGFLLLALAFVPSGRRIPLPLVPTRDRDPRTGVVLP